MKLQNIIIPSLEICTEEELYFRKSEDSQLIFNGDAVTLDEKSEMYFDTYFNSFSIGKWKKYSKIQNIYVALKFEGNIKVTLLHKERVGIGQDVMSRKIKEVIIKSSGEEVIISIDDTNIAGMYSVDIQALSETKFYGGFFGTDINKEEIQDIKIALNVCTFRRELFVKKNMDMLINKVFNSSKYSEFQENLEVFIIDNAKTLNKSDFQNQHIHLFANQNVGGAGGFTRGLLEIKEREKLLNITHALLMDDDIVIEPESIFRTWTLLSVIKDEFEDAFIGGAMLRLDRQYIQTESGAVWNQGILSSRKSGLDLRNVESCLYNEIEEGIDYSAWWYTVIPLSIVTEENLPLPIFIRGDDVEYGLRNAKTIIMMNGICVWHEPFENKYASTMFYYILRNRLIDNAIHQMTLSKKEIIQILYQLTREEMYLYRYKNAELLLDGVEDYLKGIDWLKEQNGEDLHKKIIEMSYGMQYIEKLEVAFDYGIYSRSFSEPENTSFLHRLRKRLSVNGALWTAKRSVAIVPVVGCREINVYRTERILNYDAVTQKGFITMQNKEDAKKCIKRLKKIEKMIIDKYENINTEYRERHRELMNQEFWKSYLSL